MIGLNIYRAATSFCWQHIAGAAHKVYVGRPPIHQDFCTNLRLFIVNRPSSQNPTSPLVGFFFAIG